MWTRFQSSRSPSSARSVCSHVPPLGGGSPYVPRLAGWPRRLAYFVNKDMGVRLLGGETLMVLARVSDRP